ncbi:stAR-related lipid transfer protein 9 [Electrophorus electricus]|uniref:stAR-related lipid transfer protein 9 n=1 Tax=Electrophorus electricus TaxID=8005 RepID=UPI0015D004D2|nr:stAR-related lipid transfer protein 9 [Electrophorus electricus]
MANVKVAIRVRPPNSRERVDGGRIAVQVEDNVVRIKNVKPDGRLDGRAEAAGDCRQRLLEFAFDYCYWSVNPEAPNYASQEEVFQDLGVSVLAGAAEGYNVCLFAYGQTGSGKTYTMMGTPDSIGLTPRICRGLFRSHIDSPDGQNCRVEISFSEIYNERVRDLLRGTNQKKPPSLRVREHPEKGPYVQGLSQHVVSDYKQAVDLLEEGIANRITAATHVHDASSRSHAIFSIQYTQAILENNLPSEIVSKINLVDLAGSERADPQYCRDRITEGANINKSLVTLGIVISALAQNSQMCSSSQSINSVLSEGEGSQSSSLSGIGRRLCFIPYRDSVLTWLLKDSLGGNSKTIMIATVSPSCSSYNETLGTLRYAAHARNIVNKPRVNEDANVRLIRDLREEIDRLKSMLLSFSMQRNPSPSLSDERDSSLSDMVLQNELKVEQLTKDWSEGWRDKRALLERYSVDINQDRAGVQIRSLLPHLIALEPDVLTTGVTIYHLREGVTRIGPEVLPEGSACEIENQNGIVTLRPLPHSVCMVNSRDVTEPCRLAQGAVITLGGLRKFRFNHPAEAAVLRERRRTSEGGLLCSSSVQDELTLCLRMAAAGSQELGDGPPPRQRLEEQQRYVECLREEIQVEQRRAERDLEREQAHLRQQRAEILQWILEEKQHLSVVRERGTLESGMQTDLIPLPALAGVNKDSLEEGDPEMVNPLMIVVGVRKRVVQEELLKHHALRRAENRIRRKRLQYQLERIARKRHLLEAKRELQRLENAFAVDGLSSPELASPKCRGRLVLRRHSFSADLLSRLYTHQTPIFSQFLRRNRSSEFTASFTRFACPGKWGSEEYLPDQITRGRSNTMPSRYGQGTSSRTGSSENLKTFPKEDRTSGGMTGGKAHSVDPESLVCNHTEDHNISSQTTLASDNRESKRVLPIIKQSITQKSSPKGTKSLPCGRSKGLETIRKALSRSVGSGIKTALSKVFRKPPLGLRGSRGAKSASRAKAQCIGEGNKVKAVGEARTMQQNCSIKTAMSCEGLAHLASLKDKKHRRWHSAEALTNNTGKWLKKQEELTEWVENSKDDSSDCDSLFSVDSLSSAYTKALAEQLKQENCEPSEAESEDSQMSKDSLVMDISRKLGTAGPVPKAVQSSCCSFQSSFNLQSGTGREKLWNTKEMPTEAFWSLHGSPKIVAKQSSQPVPESRASSNASVREPENLLTDAWSSTDAADSPRSLRASGGFMKKALHTPAGSCSNQSSASLDLSSTVNESEGQRSPYSASLEHQSSERETSLDYYWKEHDSTYCSTSESTILNMSDELLSNSKSQYNTEEACITENVVNNPSSDTNTHQHDTLRTNKSMTSDSESLEAYDMDVLIVNTYSKDNDGIPDESSSGCLPSESLNGYLQSSTTNQTILDEHTIPSYGGNVYMKRCSKQDEHFTQTLQETGYTEGFDAFQFDSDSRNISVPKNDGHHSSVESLHSNNAIHSDNDLGNVKGCFILSDKEHHHVVMHCSETGGEFSQKAQSRTEHVGEAVGDGKSLVQYQGVSVFASTESCTENYNARDTKDYTFVTDMKEENYNELANTLKPCDVHLNQDSYNASYKHSKKSIKTAHDVLTGNMQILKSCIGSLPPCDFAVVEIKAATKFDDSSSTSKDSAGKLSPIKNETSVKSSSDHKRGNLEQNSKVPSVGNAVYRNSSSPVANCTSDNRSAVMSTNQHMIAQDLMNDDEMSMEEVKYDASYVEVMEREVLCNRKIYLSINEKISEVVKEHLNMSLKVDVGEDISRELEPNGTISANGVDDLMKIQSKHEIGPESSHTLLFETEPEPPTEESARDKAAICCHQKEYSHTEKEIVLHHTANGLGCLSGSMESCTVEIKDSDNHSLCKPVPYAFNGQGLGNIKSPKASNVLSAESIDNHPDDLLNQVMKERSKPRHLTLMSSDIECTEVLRGPDYVTSKPSEDDQCALMKSETTPIGDPCHNLTPTSTAVRTESGFGFAACTQEKAPARNCLPEMSSSSKINDVQASGRYSEIMVDHLTFEMQKEAALSKPVKASKADMAAEFQQVLEGGTTAHLGNERKIQFTKNIQCSFNSNLCHEAAECYFQAAGSIPFNALDHQECTPENLEKCHISIIQDHNTVEQNTSSIMTKSNNNNHTYYGELNKDTTVSQASQALLKTHAPSQPQRESRSQVIQRVIMDRNTYNGPQPDHQAACKGDSKHHRIERNIQDEEMLEPANELRVCSSSTLADSAGSPRRADQTDTGEVNKPEAKSAATSDLTMSLNMNPKRYGNNKSEFSQKATVGEHAVRFTPCGSNDGRSRIKPKRYRRAHFTAPPSSSTDSTPDSSLDETAKTLIQQCSRTVQATPGVPAVGKKNAVAENESESLSPDKLCTSSVVSQGDSSMRESYPLEIDIANPRVGVTIGNTTGEAEENSLRHRPSHLTTKIFKTGLSNTGEGVYLTRHVPNGNKHKEAPSSDKNLMQNREPMLHFASSDINPFIHTTKADELLRTVPKNQAFGSAVNISRLLSPLESSEKHITRCCSVDNGLNVLNSPFNSHLSSYAIHKGLSSTLSSVEDSKEHSCTESQLKGLCHTSFVFNEKTLADLSSESCNNTSDLGHSSGQVDEIVLVYSSDHETQESGLKGLSKCDHSTQTFVFDEDLKKKLRHKRSHTQVPVSSQTHGTSTTWASLQNMSAHLSELILNTSDLLGNIQCMRSGERFLLYENPAKNSSYISAVHSDKYCKSDGSTQTVVDIGIQTEDTSMLMKQSKVVNQSPAVENAKAHEVNVTVRVIGTGSCGASKQDGITKSYSEWCENKQPFETIKSMPDLRSEGLPPSVQLDRKLEVSASKVVSLENVVANQSYPSPKAVTAATIDHISNPSSKCFGVCAHRKGSSAISARDNQLNQREPKPRNCPDKRILVMDRASSPILTVEVPSCFQKEKTKSAQCLSNHKKSQRHRPSETQLSTSFKGLLESKQMSTTENQALHQTGQFHIRQKETIRDNRQALSVSLENLTDTSCTNADSSVAYSIESIHSSGTHNEGRKKLFNRVQSGGLSQSVLCSSQSCSCSSSVKHGQPENCSQSQLKSSTPLNQSYKNSMLEYNRSFSDGMGKCWNDMSKRILQHQEEDAVSLSPSECNTDVLVNVDPLTDTSPIKEDQQLPEDLPMHNKFNNWSGINQPPPAGLTNKSNPTVAKNSGVNTQNLHTSLAESERTGSGPKPEFLEVTDKRTREIERLRKDREQVMASVRLDLSSPQLSVELKEAKLHYGLGETDTMLKLLKSSPREEPVISTNQQLYERHRRSIDGLRKEREARLQTCRRARSLSPSKHPNSSAQRPSHLPSRRREYLQQLRQEVVQTSRVPDPQRRGGQYPPDIELLLRDYSRAREEARTEIARARERLRERTEQEKRRLQQQALAQAVKDDIKIRTRVSNSTLCTGSNLSLSSGPTSGYNSSNAALLKDSGSPSLQIPGISDAGFRVKNQPSVIPFQNSKAPRVWLSAQDVRLETPPSGLELQSCSSPSTPPARQRTFSFGWPSSVSTSYQDIADCTLDSALSEVHLASGGDLRNLLEGKAAAGWRHQGMERGVQTFHRPSSRPSAHGFLGAMELDRPLASVWNLIRDHSKTHLFHESLRSAWTRSLDDSTQLVYLLTDPANCHLKQPRDFCCLSTESKQNDMWVLAMQSVFEESLPRPSADTIRAEMLPSAWVLQPSQCRDRIVLIVTYLLQVDLGTPSLPKRFLNVVARSQAAVIADLESFLSS